MRKDITIGSLACVVAVSAALGGCSQGNDLHQWVAQEKAKKGAPLEPLPVIKTFETFEYADQEQRDPFNASADDQEQAVANGPHPDQDRPREPLEAFPLDGLKMSGTLGLAKAIEGLVRDPDGVVHRVHVGNYLGQNYGRITSIGEDHIELVELVPNGSGGWMERQATIALGDTKK
jgi:type IV pilus assembly protein PilP